MKKTLAMIATCLLVPSAAEGQESIRKDVDASPAQADPPVVATPAPPSGKPVESSSTVNPRTLPKGTDVTFTISETLGSKTSAIDQRFRISLSKPITLANGVVVPAGITGVGEVVHAARARFGGKAGELILAVRYLTCGSSQIPLGRFRYGATGANRSGGAMAASLIFTPAGYLIPGGEIVIPAGTVGTARTTADVILGEAGPGTCG